MRPISHKSKTGKHPLKTIRGHNKTGNRKNKGSPSNARRIANIEKGYQVVQLRKDGYTVLEIAEALRLTVGRVRDLIKETLFVAIHETAETVEENRQLQIDRLDAMLKQFTPLTQPHYEWAVDKMTGEKVPVLLPPNPIYAQIVIKIEERRSKLLALDKMEEKVKSGTGVREYVGVDVDKV